MGSDVLPADILKAFGEHVPEQQYVAAEIEAILSIKIGETETSWLEIRARGQREGREPGTHFVTFRHPGTLEYVPLGALGWTIARRISLYPHPKKPYYLLNHRLIWRIDDQWKAHKRWYTTFIFIQVVINTYPHSRKKAEEKRVKEMEEEGVEEMELDL